MIWDFIKNHYKLILLILLPIGAFAGGRYSAPTTYKDHEVYSEQAVSTEVEKRVAAYKQEYEKKLKVNASFEELAKILITPQEPIKKK